MREKLGNCLQRVKLSALCKRQTAQQIHKTGQRVISVLRGGSMSTCTDSGDLCLVSVPVILKLHTDCLSRLCLRTLKNGFLNSLHNSFCLARNDIDLCSRVDLHDLRQCLGCFKLLCKMPRETSLLHIYKRVGGIR